MNRLKACFRLLGPILLAGCASVTAAQSPAPDRSASKPAPSQKRPEHLPAGLWKKLQAVDRKAEKIENLQAKFVQEKHTLLLKKPLVSTGSIVQIGRRVLIRTDRPRPSVVAMDAKRIRMYYPKDKVLEVYPMHRAAGRLAAWPMLRPAQMADRFHIEPLPADPQPDLLALRLKPRHKPLSERIEKIDVRIDPNRGVLTYLEIHEVDGDRTVMKLSDIRINQKLKDEAVELNVPEQVRVIRPAEDKNQK
ncbi:MAG: outer membrane lipoprotein carrier protein LolA [Phycisphaeraceae bacterium]|nr:outer membrane lipoprotein carrier protein LolA [Phycisphaeraceae bacterium]